MCSSDLNISDGIHPNSKGHEIIANNLLPILLALLEKYQFRRVNDEEHSTN